MSLQSLQPWVKTGNIPVGLQSDDTFEVQNRVIRIHTCSLSNETRPRYDPRPCWIGVVSFLLERRKKSRSSRKLTIPISLAAPVIVTFTKRMPSGRSMYDDVMKGDLKALGYDLTEMIGIEAPSGKFNMEYLMGTIWPFIGGFVLHKAANYLGINRWMSRNKIPLIRI